MSDFAKTLESGAGPSPMRQYVSRLNERTAGRIFKRLVYY